MTTLGRFKIISGNPPVLPHKCAVCGTCAANEQYLDFGLDLDFYGTVYLCRSCFREAANELGYYSPAQHHIALDQVDIFRKENNRLKDIVEAYKNVIGNITDINTASLSSIDTDTIPLEPVQEYRSSSTEPLRNNIPVEGPESGSVKQINEQGPSDVQRDDSLDDLINEI